MQVVPNKNQQNETKVGSLLEIQAACCKLSFTEGISGQFKDLIFFLRRKGDKSHISRHSIMSHSHVVSP